jgi:peptidoglycan hydrolase-like protein with peptidoglycan-binding domain
VKKTVLAASATCMLCVFPSMVFAATSSQSQPHQQTVTHQTPVSKPTPHLIEYGSTGMYVKEVQQQLNKDGDNVGTVDGDFGPKTLAGVKEFQKSHGLTVDGIVGPETWNALFNSGTVVASAHSGFHHPQQWNENSILKEGDSGIEVKNMQYILDVMQFYTATGLCNVDGIFGPQTKQAVITYQKAHGLTPDGVVGPQTWTSFAHYVQKKSSSTYGLGGYMGLRIEWVYNNTSDTSGSTAYVYGDGTTLSDTYRLTAS